MPPTMKPDDRSARAGSHIVAFLAPTAAATRFIESWKLTGTTATTSSSSAMTTSVLNT
jgi:hypothetical protein